MIYCIRTVNIPDAHEAAKMFIKDLEAKNKKDTILEIRRHRVFPVIKLKSDIEIHFVSDTVYKKWCLRRTYKIIGDDKTYHSGRPVKDKDCT